MDSSMQPLPREIAPGTLDPPTLNATLVLAHKQSVQNEGNNPRSTHQAVSQADSITLDVGNTPVTIGPVNAATIDANVHGADNTVKEMDAAPATEGRVGVNGEPPDPLGSDFIWDFPLFVPINRPHQYSLHPEGIHYLEARLPECDKIEGPLGKTVEEYENRLGNLRLKWKKDLSEMYLSHYPNFDWHSVLPPNPSARQLKAAKRCVFVKIDNMLARKHHPEQEPDIIDQLFHVAKKPTVSVLWARACADYPERERIALLAAGWTPKMMRREAFPIQVRVRAKLFRELPEEEQHEWQEKAKKFKTKSSSKDEVIATLPKLFAMIGDAIADKMGWFLEIRAAGLGTDEKPHFFVERYKPIVDGKMMDYGDFPAAEAYNDGFHASVAGAHSVDVSNVTALPPWKPEISKPVLKVVQLTLSGIVDLDENGIVTTPFEELGESVQSYVEQAFALVHIGWSRTKKAPKPNWDEIAKREGESLRQFIDPERLPPGPFEFRSPRSLRERSLFILAQWIVDGEAGKRDTSTHFRWQGQKEPLIVRDLRPATQHSKKEKKQTKVSSNMEEGENGGAATTKRKKRKNPAPSGSRKKLKTEVVASAEKQDEADTQPTTSSTMTPFLNTEESTHKMQAKTNSTKKKSVADSDMDSNTDAEELKEGAFIVKGKATIPHARDYERWFFDLKNRSEDLDWESENAKVMECDVVTAARFVEAAELQRHMELGASLDVIQPMDVVDQPIANLVEAVLDSSKVLPAISSYRRISKWDQASSILLTRAEGFLSGLTSHEANRHWSFVKVGGKAGLFPALRCLELVRRAVETRPGLQDVHSRLDAVMDAYHLWRYNKWRGQWPTLIKEIAVDAGLREREVEPWYFAVRHDPENWSRQQVKEEMQEWIKEMNETLYMRGSIVEKFLWCYGLYMLKRATKASMGHLFDRMIEQTCLWLLKDAEGLDLGITEARHKLLGQNLWDSFLSTSQMLLPKSNASRAGSSGLPAAPTSASLTDHKATEQDASTPINLSTDDHVGAEHPILQAITSTPIAAVDVCSKPFIIAPHAAAVVEGDMSNMSIVKVTEDVIRVALKQCKPVATVEGGEASDKQDSAGGSGTLVEAPTKPKARRKPAQALDTTHPRATRASAKRKLEGA
ncbi:hypothetical protein M422DRAFT_269622 [Sphaerobolus stellatus SS14]|uniref:Uncharacterized protein n=1 Tax=Sphaerobolus stellatus (strain SS14) TaxID=990650 RepID=A0A0C9UUK8_SPHS4|nr:hypothetical protein M422DRAFT_269622 [Sphaerobolus stellatus SS14]